jgi:hypothetical protein
VFNGKPLVTDWTDWRDLFADETVIPGDKLMEYSKRDRKARTTHTWRVKGGDKRYPFTEAEMYLDRFMSLKRLDRTIYLEVIPTVQLVRKLEPHVTFVENDTMNFKAIEWDDGRTLITCENNRIIAGPWVAKINSITIPDLKED